MTSEAIEILEAAREVDGLIYEEQSADLVLRIATETKELLPWQSPPKETANYRGAIQDLLADQFVELEREQQSRTIYRLTRKGWNWRRRRGVRIRS